jgi:hypothetical protein
VYVEMDRCTADAVAHVTGVKLGRRSLKFMDYGIMAAAFVNLNGQGFPADIHRGCPQPCLRLCSGDRGQVSPAIGSLQAHAGQCFISGSAGGSSSQRV